MERRASPVRTCVGCRRRAPASELLRAVAVERRTIGNVAESPNRESGGAHFVIVADPRRRRPGRGVNVHPNPDCFALAEKRRAFGRALRISGVIDTGELAEFVSTVTAQSGPATAELGNNR